MVCRYYEWLKKGKERLPHFTKRADGKLMLLAGLWDSVVLEGATERLWTFTIVTRAASKDMEFFKSCPADEEKPKRPGKARGPR